MLQRASLRSTARLVALAFAGGVAMPSFATAAVPGSAVTWVLSSAAPARSCEMSLKFDAGGAAGGLTLPAGCRHAIPAVRLALAWSIGDAGEIDFTNAVGQTVLAFERQIDGTWRATDGSGQVLLLTPATAAAAAAAPAQADDGPFALSTTPMIAAGPVAEVADPVKPRKSPAADQASAKDVAGRYAVMRGDRDTGCMVTLESEGRGSKGGLRARLAPACRDQGIIIFDPIGWQMKGSNLSLTARKGHTIELSKDANGTFTKMPQDAKALGLKRL